MQPPTLTFACELDTARPTDLFDDPSVLADLQTLQARVVLMLSDYHPERARVVAQLNDAGIPVVGVPLVPADEGYYFTPDNVPQARASTPGSPPGRGSTVSSGTPSASTLNPTPPFTSS